MADKLYIGDGVYIERSSYGFVLTTENGLQITNTIYLEPEVATHAIQYMLRIPPTDPVREALDPKTEPDIKTP